MLDGKQVTPVEVSALYINRYSENAEAAVRFLEIYSSPEVQREYLNGGNGMFLPDYREYSHYESVWMLFGDSLIPTDEEFEQYKNLLSTGYQFYRNQEFEKVERKLFQQFIYDELTTDEFIAELQERADLMLGE